MLERKFCSNFILVFFGLIVCLSVWRIVSEVHEDTATSTQTSAVVPVYTLNTLNASYTYPMQLLPTADYATLIDLDDFKFKILNKVCESSDTLLVLVHSAPQNFEKRRTIRKTWGRKRKNMKVIFALGETEDAIVQKLLEEENKVHGDFIQGRFLDTYRNVTYKHVMVFKYAIYHCPQAKYVLKTDDDVFVNVPAMVEFLSVELSPYGAYKLLLCMPVTSRKVKRTYRSKWRVSYREYPDSYYPPYCAGWALLYSPDVVFALYQDAQRTKYFWIDDVLITGVLAKKNNIEHTDLNTLILTKHQITEICNGSGTFNSSKLFLYGQPDLTTNEIYTLWEFVNNHTTTGRNVL